MNKGRSQFQFQLDYINNEERPVLSARSIEFKLTGSTCVRVICLLTDWPQCCISCNDMAVALTLLQQNAHYTLELVGLLKLWEKLLFMSSELTFKTNTAILKQGN